MVTNPSLLNLNTTNRLRILINISYLKKFEGTLYDFEKKLGVTRGNPESRAIFRALIEKKIMYPARKVYSCQLFKVHIKKLCELIEEQGFVQELRKYFDYLH